MQYNKLGKAGIKLSELGFGSWITFAKQFGYMQAKELIHTAYDHGVNFFDNAESYAQGQAEILMGQVLKDFRREDLVVSTKIFWGGEKPNDTGLSRKHLIEGTQNSLRRLQMDYVDLLFCHRPDPNTPLEETVLAMDYLVRNNYAFYWGTSEWSAEAIDAAFHIAHQLGCIPPTMEQPVFNLFKPQHIEIDYQPLFKKYGLGTTTWSPLAYGILSGKYQQGIPSDSRLAKESWLTPEDFQQKLTQVAALLPIAKGLNCTLAQLAIAWCLKHPEVSSVIVGATKTEQLLENLGAIPVKEKLTTEILTNIKKIMRA